MVYYNKAGKTKQTQTTREINAMTSLRTDSKRFHPVAGLVSDIESAIESHQTLRKLMGKLRDIDLYHGKLNIKTADLKTEAIAILAALRVDLSDIESFKAANPVDLMLASESTRALISARLRVEDAKIEQIPLDEISDICLQWLSYLATPGIIMVTQNFSSNGCDKWVTFGSHSRIFSLLTGRETINERGISKIEIPKAFISAYELRIQNEGVPITFVY